MRVVAQVCDGLVCQGDAILPSSLRVIIDDMDHFGPAWGSFPATDSYDPARLWLACISLALRRGHQRRTPSVAAPPLETHGPPLATAPLATGGTTAATGAFAVGGEAEGSPSLAALLSDEGVPREMVGAPAARVASWHEIGHALGRERASPGYDGVGLGLMR